MSFTGGIRDGMAGGGGILKFATFAALGAIAINRQYRQESRRYAGEAERIKSIGELKAKIRQTYPTDLAERLISKFEDTGEAAHFDFEAETARYFDIKLYNFLLKCSNERFADRLMERKAKFANYEVTTTLTDLFARTAEELGATGVNPDQVEALFNEWLEREQAAATEKLSDPTDRTLVDIKTRQMRDAKRASLIETCNMFLTDTGYALVTEDYKVAYVEAGLVKAYPNISAYQSAYPRNRRWEIVQDHGTKENAIIPMMNPIVNALY